VNPFPQLKTDGEARDFLAKMLRPGTGKDAVLAAFAEFGNASVRRNHGVEIEFRVKDARPSGKPGVFKPVTRDGKVTFHTGTPMIDLFITVRFDNDRKLRSWKFVYATLPA